MTSTTAALRNPGSFRDPSGYVFHVGDRVYRALNESAGRNYDAARDSGLLAELVDRQYLIPSTDIETASVRLPTAIPGQIHRLIEHPRIAVWSYPYEWTFSALRAAALLHLDLHLFALQRRFTLSDATAYNVQLIGAKPIFVDLPSLRPYVSGEFWFGHRQFCEQFLNPLLLQSWIGIGYHDWYRGRIDGIAGGDLARLLPRWRKLSLRVLTHVTLPASLQQRELQTEIPALAKRPGLRGGLSLEAMTGLLRQLRDWIADLRGPAGAVSDWSGYATVNSYHAAEREAKDVAVRSFVGDIKPKLLIDLGCNSGDYALAALESGAQRVVGFDTDDPALERGYELARSKSLSFLPLKVDLTNPSPSQGWAARERPSIRERLQPEALLALAVIHHLSIGRNVPLELVADELLSLAPHCLVEFVPKCDPMVKFMLRNRADIFADYSLETFRSLLSARSRIVSESVISASGRVLFRCVRKP